MYIKLMETTCCAILAGGKAERLPNKPFLLLDGKPLISYVIGAVDGFFSETLVIAKKENKEDLEKLTQNKKQIKIIFETTAEFSPWNGIRAAVENTKAEWILLLACDMPFISTNLFDLLVSKINPNIDCIIPKTDRLQPLCALYRRSVFESARMEGSITRFAESLKKEIVQINEKYSFWLFNINTREDLEMAKKRFSASNRHAPFRAKCLYIAFSNSVKRFDISCLVQLY